MLIIYYFERNFYVNQKLSYGNLERSKMSKNEPPAHPLKFISGPSNFAQWFYTIHGPNLQLYKTIGDIDPQRARARYETPADQTPI